MRLVTLCAAFLLVCGVLAHPTCSYICDDPVWNAVCEPDCKDPVCVYTTPCGRHEVPNMKIRCPKDMLEMDNCPQCETVTADDDTAECSAYIQCEQTQCSWSCYNPGSPRKINCQEQCEQAACMSVGNGLSVFF